MSSNDDVVGRIVFGGVRTGSELRKVVLTRPVDSAEAIRRLRDRVEVLTQALRQIADVELTPAQMVALAQTALGDPTSEGGADGSR